MILSPLLFVLGCAVTGDDAQESTSQTDDSLSAARPSGHHCLVIGNTIDGIQGVHCADVHSQENPNSWQLTAAGQAYCQTPAGAVQQCASIRQNVQLIVDGLGLPSDQFGCGHLGSAPCPTGRFQHDGRFVTVTKFGDPNTCHTVQARMFNDVIELPKSDMNVGPATVLSVELRGIFCG